MAIYKIRVFLVSEPRCLRQGWLSVRWPILYRVYLFPAQSQGCSIIHAVTSVSTPPSTPCILHAFGFQLLLEILKRMASSCAAPTTCSHLAPVACCHLDRLSGPEGSLGGSLPRQPHAVTTHLVISCHNSQ